MPGDDRPKERVVTLLAAVGALYFAEGFPYGIVTELFPIYLRSKGVGLVEIGLLSTVGLAWTLKFLWAPLVDRVGRRTLMLGGCAAIGLSHLLLGGAYAAGLKGLPVLVFTLCSLGAYALSLAPVTWVLIAEIFPNRVRGPAVSVAVSALWVACFILTFAFPLLQRTAGIAATFWIYAAVLKRGSGEW